MRARRVWAKIMKDKRRIDDIEVKKANILHHDVEAEIFERAHPEGSSIYEKSKVSRSIGSIAENSEITDLCVDVGCGTGFATSFELPFYRTVVAADISRRMLEVTRKRLGHSSLLNLIVCDAECLPLRSEIADLVSVSSVLHHLPKPFNSMTEISRLLKEGGFLYVTREPNFRLLRRFFAFFDQMVVQKTAKLMGRLSVFKSEPREPTMIVDGLDYDKVDVHYPTGFHIFQLTELLSSKHLEIISAYSYHWIYPDSDKDLLQQLLTKTNFIIEKVPLSEKLGRYISIIARKPRKIGRNNKEEKLGLMRTVHLAIYGIDLVGLGNKYGTVIFIFNRRGMLKDFSPH